MSFKYLNKIAHN